MSVRVISYRSGVDVEGSDTYEEALRADYRRATCAAKLSAARYLAALNSARADLPELAEAAAHDASFVAFLARRVRRPS